MSRVQGAGEEPVLPEVAVAAEPGVGVLCISAVGSAEGLGQRIDLFRDGDPMYVIGHQAMDEQTDLKAFSLPGHKIEVNVAIEVLEEDGLAVDAAMGEVVCEFGQHGSGHAGHSVEVVGGATKVLRENIETRWTSPGFPQVSPKGAIPRVCRFSSASFSQSPPARRELI